MRDFLLFWTLSEKRMKPSTSVAPPSSRISSSRRAVTIFRSSRRNRDSSWLSHATSAVSGSSAALAVGKRETCES